MPEFRIEAHVDAAHGTQTFKINAETKQDAIDIFNKGGGDFVEQDVEVVSLDPVSLEDVYEFEE